MARIQKIAATPTTVKLNEVSNEMNETNDCAVTALAVATGKTYKQAHKALKAAGRADRKGTTVAEVMNAAEQLGFKMERVSNDVINDIISRYPGVHKTLQHITTHHPVRFPKVWAELVEPMIFHVSGHFAGYRDNQLHDWSINGAKRVIDLFKFTPIEA